MTRNFLLEGRFADVQIIVISSITWQQWYLQTIGCIYRNQMIGVKYTVYIQAHFHIHVPLNKNMYDDQMICGSVHVRVKGHQKSSFSQMFRKAWSPVSGVRPNTSPVEGYKKTCPAPQTPPICYKKKKIFFNMGKSSSDFWGPKEKHLENLSI